MNNKITLRLAPLVSAFTLLSGISFTAQAQQPGQAPMTSPVQAPAPVQPYRPAYGSPYRAVPRSAYGPYRGAPAPRYGNRYGNTPYRSGPYRGSSNRPWGGRNMPWGNRKGFGRGLPIDVEGNYIPWSSRFWNELGEGGRNPLKDMDEWIDPNEPREGFANWWDDMINAPHDAGRMPGGVQAPSVVVPNPVDVQKEFENTAKDMPEEMRYQMDNINIQTW